MSDPQTTAEMIENARRMALEHAIRLIMRKHGEWMREGETQYAVAADMCAKAIRDMTDGDTLEREQMDEDQYRNTLSA